MIFSLTDVHVFSSVSSCLCQVRCLVILASEEQIYGNMTLFSYILFKSKSYFGDNSWLLIFIHTLKKIAHWVALKKEGKCSDWDYFKQGAFTVHHFLLDWRMLTIFKKTYFLNFANIWASEFSNKHHLTVISEYAAVTVSK